MSNSSHIHFCEFVSDVYIDELTCNLQNLLWVAEIILWVSHGLLQKLLYCHGSLHPLNQTQATTHNRNTQHLIDTTQQEHTGSNWHHATEAHKL